MILAPFGGNVNPFDVFNTIAVIFTGLVFGSFATAVSWRVSRGVSWISQGKAPARSACPSCGTALSFPDLVPLFSWIFLKGRCRHCGTKISPIYPLTEITVTLACLGIYWSNGFTVPAFIMMAAVPFLAALMVIDLKSFLLPDQLVLSLGVLALLWLLSQGIFGGGFNMDFLKYAAGRLAAGIIYAMLAWGTGLALSALLKKEALGFGDVKFFGVSGLWLGLGFLPGFLMLSGIFGVVLGIIWQRVKKQQIFPFGPALIVALYCGFLATGMGIAPF